MLTYRLPHPEIEYQHIETKSQPVEVQFEEEDLGENVYNPLGTPAVMPVQDKDPTVVKEAIPVEGIRSGLGESVTVFSKDEQVYII